MGKAEFLASRRLVFFIHISGWSPSATDQWRGPYQTVSSAQAQATRMTRYPDGAEYGDWTATIYKLEPNTLTLVDVNAPARDFSGFGGDPIDKELVKKIVKGRQTELCSYCGDFAYGNSKRCGPNGCYNCPA